MAHMIKVAKNEAGGYSRNNTLITLLIVGYACFIFYIVNFVFSIYSFGNQHIARPLIPLEIQGAIYIVYLISIFASVLFVSYDAKKLNAGCAYNLNLSKTQTWGPTRWGWLTFLFWPVILPFYLIRRKKIYYTNKRAMENHPNYKPEPVVLISKQDAVLAVILIIVILIALAVPSYS